MPSSITPAPPNPYYLNPERAPYELGNLLLQLPEKFSPFTPQRADVLLKASAAASHAHNANHVLLHGLEAIGKTLFVAGTNESWELGPETLAHLGFLIQHLAVEAQFLQETEQQLSYVVSSQMQTN